jgi:putative copper resistance protein D
VDLSGWDAAAVCAKAVTYAATLGSSGAVFFLIYCGELLQHAQQTRIKRLIAGLAGAALIGSAARILIMNGSIAENFSGMFNAATAGMILGAGEGRATGLRIIGLLGLVFVPFANRRLLMFAAAGALAASISFAWVGHIHALPGVGATLLIGVHLACAAFWLGALTPLLWAARGDVDSQLAALAARFGKLALYVVGLLLAAGGGLLWILIRSAAEFWASDYGLAMALKLLAVACLLSIAAVNKLNLTPRLLKGEPRARAAFARCVRLEIYMGAAVLLITAAFTTLTGPPD